MAESPYITAVTRADFAAKVVEKSREVPVLVDFWAEWCGPCRMLDPVLRRLVEQYDGTVLLVKVNTDAEQELAQEHGIRGIPAVKLYRHGSIAGEFVGVQPEAAIRELVDRFITTPADGQVEQAAQLARAGNWEEAVSLLRRVTAEYPQHDRAKLELAQLLCLAPAAGDEAARAQECRQLLDGISVRAAGDPAFESARARLDLLRAAAGAPPREVLERTVAADAGAHAARFQLAARLALAQDYAPAMEHLLEIVRRDRGYGDDAARRALVGMFTLLGQRHPLVTRYRALLSRALN